MLQNVVVVCTSFLINMKNHIKVKRNTLVRLDPSSYLIKETKYNILKYIHGTLFTKT